MVFLLRKASVLFLALVFMLFSWSLTGIAGAACVTGTSVIKTDSDEEVEEATDEQIEEGQKKAISDAWNRYIKSLDGDHLKAYMEKKSQILGNRGFYISNLKKEASREFSESDQVLKSTVCLNIDKARISSVLNVKKEPEVIKSGEGSLFTALFVARQAASGETFDAIVQKRKSSSSKSKAKEMARTSGGKALSYTEQKSKSSRRSGGSTIRKSDEIRYKIISDEAAMTSVSKELVRAGYEFTPYGELEGAGDECGRIPSAATVSSVFKSKNKMPGRHWNKIRKAARKCEFKYFARGTMTADVARNYRGRKQVYVRINVAVYDVSRRFSRKVSTVQEQARGQGPNEDVARINALRRAGTITGEAITKELLKKGLR